MKKAESANLDSAFFIYSVSIKTVTRMPKIIPTTNVAVNKILRFNTSSSPYILSLLYYRFGQDMPFASFTTSQVTFSVLRALVFPVPAFQLLDCLVYLVSAYRG